MPRGTQGMTAENDWGKSPARKHRAIGMLRKLAQTAQSERIRLQAIMLLLRIEGVEVPLPEVTPIVKPQAPAQEQSAPAEDEAPASSEMSQDAMSEEEALLQLRRLIED
jgi:hypothetical protein